MPPTTDQEPETATPAVLTPMPRYKCHKEVCALKIRVLDHNEDGTNTVTPELGFSQITLPKEFVDKHRPQAGGYLVVYDDGYRSYSPEKPFEEGYRLIARAEPTTAQERVRQEKKDLDAKSEKLASYLERLAENERLATDPSPEHIGLLNVQLAAMGEYSSILERRLLDLERHPA